MRRILTAALFAALAGIPAGARADLPGDVPDRFRIDLGGMASASTTEAAVGSVEAGLGATVNFEDIFNIPEGDSVLRFAGAWRITKRQHIDFGYVAINRGGGREITEDIDWGDFQFLAGGDVHATFKADFPYLAWRWDFLQDPRVHISGTAGINYMGLAATLEATGDVEDQQGNAISGEVSEEASVRFPVPQFGLQVDWAPSKRTLIQMYSRLIYVGVSDFKGSVTESALRFYWYFTRHVGIAAGIEQERIHLKEYVKNDAKAKFEYAVSGFTFYIATAF